MGRLSRTLITGGVCICTYIHTTYIDSASLWLETDTFRMVAPWWSNMEAVSYLRALERREWQRLRIGQALKTDTDGYQMGRREVREPYLWIAAGKKDDWIGSSNHA